MNDMKETVVRLMDGKYELRHEHGRNFRALRYGEPWRDLAGDGMVLALVQRIEELEEAATLKAAQGGVTEAMEALWPFACAYRRLRHYGDSPTDETPLYAYAGEGHPLYELLNGEHGERLTVQTLGEAAAALEAALSAQQQGQGDCPCKGRGYFTEAHGEKIPCDLCDTAPPAQSAQHGSGAARYINTGSPRWDSAAFKAWQEGNRPGSHNWMKRMRELLATKPAQPAERVPDGWKLAMLVLQSDLYRKLPEEERAVCDALVAENPYIAATPAAPADGDGKEVSRG